MRGIGTLVLAGSREQYAKWVISESIPGRRHYYALNADTMRSIEVEDVIVIGDFWDREHAKELYQLALTRVR